MSLCLPGRPGSPGAPVLAVLLAALLGATTSVSSRQSSPPASGRAGQVRDSGGVDRRSGSAVIRGRVVRADNGQPLRSVRIQTRGPGVERGAGGRTVPDQLTDADGRFELTGLVAGRYTLTLSKGGYITLGVGGPIGGVRSQTTAIEVGNGQVVEGSFALTKGAVIAGRVVDE